MVARKRILFILPYPKGVAPSQRFRLEHYLDAMKSNRMEYTYASFLDKSTWDILYRPGYHFKKIGGVLKGFFRRFLLLFTLFRYHFVFIHREASPIGPPIFEWLITQVWRKKVIYDFDDAIWMSDTSTSNKFVACLKWPRKVSRICRWAQTVTCGNAYLANYASQFQKNTIIIPTVVNTKTKHKRLQNQAVKKIGVGWTGSHSTMPYLNSILPSLKKLQAKIPFVVYIISNRKPEFELPYLHFIEWSKNTEIEDLLSFHIGLMPLEDTEWAKGKCGFKAIQYMALGMPALVSPVGVNPEIVEEGICGFHCTNAEDWERKLEKLLNDESLRIQFGKTARQRIEAKYSVQATVQLFLSLFE